METSSDGYYGIIVTYNPDYGVLHLAIRELLQAGVNVIVFDNTPSPLGVSDMRNAICSYAPLNKDVLVLGDGFNYGLGYAYNTCIDRLKACNPKGVLFFDQDSQVSSSRVRALLGKYESLSNNGNKIGVIGGQPIRKSGKPYRVHLIRDLERLGPGLIETDFVISSFSLIPFDVFLKVGPFRSDLFIDLVDSEYSYRCRKFGYLVITCTLITFIHDVGEGDLKLFGKSTSAVSKPLRNYYQSRNIVLVGHQYRWYWFILRKLAKRFIAITLAGFIYKDLLLRWGYFFKGVEDGARGISGIYKA